MLNVFDSFDFCYFTHMLIRIAKKEDADSIVAYYQDLSALSKQRFAPHEFSKSFLVHQIQQQSDYLSVIAYDDQLNKVVGYAVCQLWMFDYDIQRWNNYHLELQYNDRKIACFAPSVSDAAQNSGIGRQLLNYTKQRLIEKGFTHIMLWGGVKCENIPALNFYLKNGFKIVAHFDYQGGNYDMLLKIV